MCPPPASDSNDRACPACGEVGCTVFHRLSPVPVNSCLNVHSRAEALDFTCGTISMAWCAGCGLVFNGDFDRELVTYTPEYEETQSFSPTFRRFHEALAHDLVERHRLRRRTIVEIGCGKGDFLKLAREAGVGRCIGFDPAFDPARFGHHDDIDVMCEPFSARALTTSMADSIDLLVCKMTLEHIEWPATFVAECAHALEGSPASALYLLVPEAVRIIRQCAIEDIYYEHCNYFSAASLAGLLERQGFEVESISETYGGQYLAVEARPAAGGSPAGPTGELPTVTRIDIDRFGTSFQARVAKWRQRLHELDGERVVIWGSGSKAVSFLTTIGTTHCIDFVVDINPSRQGRFMPMTGQEIVAPSFLVDYRPHTVIVMNPAYRDEIRATIDSLGLVPAIVTLQASDAGW